MLTYNETINAVSERNQGRVLNAHLSGSNDVRAYEFFEGSDTIALIYKLSEDKVIEDLTDKIDHLKDGNYSYDLRKIFGFKPK